MDMSSVPGFRFAGVPLSGVKGRVGMLFSEEPDTAGAALYTQNDFKAAPVIVSQRQDQLSTRKRGILVNSGCANAFTGRGGYADADACLKAMARKLEVPAEECYIASTGVIGQRLEMGAMSKAIDELQLDEKPESALNFVHSILTTDTKPKIAVVDFILDGKTVHLAGCIKGAGMIQPNLATMLCFIITDVKIKQTLLRRSLASAAQETLNSITVDSDTSTNDTVFILANGRAGNAIISDEDERYQSFTKKLQELMQILALELIADAEGATKRLTVEVLGAKTSEAAHQAAFSIANSPLVKTAFFGEQLNWGRIVMAVGKTMIGADPETLDVAINAIPVVVKGEPQNEEICRRAEATLKQKEISIQVNLNAGPASKRVWTCDYSLEYIKINANYIS
ncbi:MAG: bifunctional glutamate N-acetyltransferase/amino-acid acetyltransferase ArgJ [candidate division FCPU426 bacterium]